MEGGKNIKGKRTHWVALMDRGDREAKNRHLKRGGREPPQKIDFRVVIGKGDS